MVLTIKPIPLEYGPFLSGPYARIVRKIVGSKTTREIRSIRKLTHLSKEVSKQSNSDKVDTASEVGNFVKLQTDSDHEKETLHENIQGNA